MARKFQGRLDEWLEYVPDAWGEREAYDNNPEEAITVELNFLSRDELKVYQRLSDYILNKRRKGKSITSLDEEKLAQFYNRHVRNVRNYDDFETGEPIETGYDLYMKGEAPIIFDITDALIDRSKLEAGLIKKS